jgi:hypothetical protein
VFHHLGAFSRAGAVYSNGKMAPTDIRTIQPVEGGVRFTRHVDLNAGGFMGWMTKRTLGMITKCNEQFVQNLKQVLEGA